MGLALLIAYNFAVFSEEMIYIFVQYGEMVTKR